MIRFGSEMALNLVSREKGDGARKFDRRYADRSRDLLELKLSR
jgi:hypothetical protein